MRLSVCLSVCVRRTVSVVVGRRWISVGDRPSVRPSPVNCCGRIMTDDLSRNNRASD